MKLLFQSIWLLGLVILSCIPVRRDRSSDEDMDTSEVRLDLKDSLIGQVLQAQNDQDLPRIFGFFNSESPAIRYAAALALGSIRDSTAKDTLAYLLDDPNVNVASAAAYSLGLIGSPLSRAAIDRF